MTTPDQRIPLDANRRTLLAALSYENSDVIVPLVADPATGELLISLQANPLVGSPLTGQAKVSVTNTAVQLNGGMSQPLTNGVIITAGSNNNTNGMTVGISTVTDVVDGTGNGYILVPGASVSFAVNNTNTIWINGTSGDLVSWAGS